VRVKEMPHRGVPADQNELTKGFAGTAFLQEPKQTLDRDIHYFFRGLLAGGQVDDMGDALHCFANQFAIGNATGNYLQSGGFLKESIVAQGSGRSFRKPIVHKKTLEETRSYLTSRASNENFHFNRE
jgi:hypothetical protein